MSESIDRAKKRANANGLATNALRSLPLDSLGDDREPLCILADMATNQTTAHFMPELVNACMETCVLIKTETGIDPFNNL